MHVVATAGHVDHGKSTLLSALTGMQPDRWAEERRRGLTIDLGFVWADLEAPDGTVVTAAFVDVPGHERFVPNMLAGAGAVRLALFVVAADDGWSAQSQEHLDILDLLGVRGAVVAVTKATPAGPDRAAEVALEVEGHLAGTTLEGAPILTVDGVDGTGVADLARTLADRLAALPDPPDTGRGRLWVDRAFTISGAGTVVTGTLDGSGLSVGREVALLPAGRRARVRGLHSLNRAREHAPPGGRVAVNLAGVDVEDVARGDAVVTSTGRDPAAGWVVTDTADVWLRALPDCAVGDVGAWHVHLGSAETTCRVHPLLGDPVEAGAPGFVHLVLDHALPVQAGDRVVLRESGRQATCGGGEVVDPLPGGARPRGVDQRLSRVEGLEAVRDADGPERVVALVRAHGGALPARTAFAAAGVAAGDPPVGLTSAGEHLLDADAAARWSTAVEDAARAHHEAHPESSGATRDALAAAATSAGCPRPVAPTLVHHLAAAGRLRRAASAYALPDFAPARDEARERRRRELLSLLDAEPFSPPTLDEAAREVGAGHEEVNELVTAGEVVRAGGVAFTRRAVDEAVRRLGELEQHEGPFTASQAREVLDTTRKWVIPLLEYLDGAGLTSFDGQYRRLRR